MLLEGCSLTHRKLFPSYVYCTCWCHLTSECRHDPWSVVSLSVALVTWSQLRSELLKGGFQKWAINMIKLCAVWNSLVEPCTGPLCSAQDVSPLFVQHVHVEYKCPAMHPRACVPITLRYPITLIAPTCENSNKYCCNSSIVVIVIGVSFSLCLIYTLNFILEKKPRFFLEFDVLQFHTSTEASYPVQLGGIKVEFMALVL